jgi:hypothetical protein
MSAFIDAALLFWVLSNFGINAPTWAALGFAAIAFRLEFRR